MEWNWDLLQVGLAMAIGILIGLGIVNGIYGLVKHIKAWRRSKNS